MQDQLNVTPAITAQPRMPLLATGIKKRPGSRQASILLAILGLGVIGLWVLTNDWSTMSSMLVLAGISLLTTAILLYFLTPDRYLRSEVYEAMCLTDSLIIGRMLSSPLVTARGIYIPAKPTGVLKLVLPLSGDVSNEELELPVDEASTMYVLSGKQIKGVVIDPPGQGLFRYVQSIGAIFTSNGLEWEIRDVMENCLEIASRVGLKADGGKVTVTMSDIASWGMCEHIRREDQGICSQTGCPLCSFVCCMVASGTGKKVRIEDVTASGRSIILTLELMEES